MFCPECGRNNPEGLTNCSSCGARLEDNQPKRKDWNYYLSSLKNFMKNKAGPFIKKHRKILIPITVVVILCVAFLKIGSAVSSPDHIVDKYVKSLISSNWSEAYKNLDLEENDFINYEKFVDYQESNDFDYSKIKNYEINELKNGTTYSSKDFEQDSVGRLKTYTVSYSTSDASTESSFNVTLVEQDEKSWLFYPSYKIAANDMFGSFSIATINGASAKIDNIDLAEYQHTNDDGYTTFNVPSLFKGLHTVELTHPLCDSYKTQIHVDNSTNTSNEYGNNIVPLSLKQEEMTSLASKTEETLKTLCNGILSDKNFDSLSIECVSDRSSVNEIKEFYSDFSSYLKKEDGTGLKNIRFYTFTDNSKQSIFDSDQIYRCTVNFSYDYTKLEKTFLTDEIKEISSEKRNNGSITITYAYEDEDWVISSIDDYRLYY